MRINIYSLIELNLIASLPVETYFRRLGRKNVDEWLWEMKRLQKSLATYNKTIRFDCQMDIVNVIHQIEKRCRPILDNFFRTGLVQKRPYLKNMPVKLKNLVSNKIERCIRKHSY